MDFQEFLQCIPKLEKEILPGEAAQDLMSPPERKDLLKKIDLNKKQPKEAAVLMLLYPKDSQTHMVLIERNAYPGVHSKQIAFPGGKIEPEDRSAQHAALRETYEEIGIAPHQVAVIRPFSRVFIPPSNFFVYPFLGYSKEELVFNPDPTEVAAVIEFSIRDFLDPNTAVMQSMDTSYSKAIEVPSFKVDDHYVWGATAMMLSELKETFKKIL